MISPAAAPCPRDRYPADTVCPVTASPDSSEAARVTGNEAWGIVSRILAGMLIYGLIAWAVGSWLGHSTAGAAIGVLLGAGLGLYLSVVRIRQLGDHQKLVVAESSSWTARMTRARIERSSEVAHGD